MEELFEKINEFCRDFDFYDYMDQGAAESLAEELTTMLENGRLFGVRTFFNDIVVNEEGTKENQFQALKLLREIERLEAVERYKFLYNEMTKSKYYVHHLNECSYFLINFYGLKDQDIRVLERELEKEA